jgi:hypothetical protein
MRTTVWRAKTVQIFSTPAPNQSFEPHCLSTMWYEEIESLAIDLEKDGTPSAGQGGTGAGNSENPRSSIFGVACFCRRFLRQPRRAYQPSGNNSNAPD